MPARMSRGILIALEGIDGSGKTSVARRLARRLRTAGLSVAVCREPNDPALGRRAISAATRDPWTAAVYFTVDRFLARPAVEDALRTHDVVISDRSFYSTLAYQGSALPVKQARALANLQRSAAICPDRIVLLELPTATAVTRLAGRPAPKSPLERRAMLRRAARAYRRLQSPPHWILVDASPPLHQVEREVARKLRPWVSRTLATRKRRS